MFKIQTQKHIVVCGSIVLCKLINKLKYRRCSQHYHEKSPAWICFQVNIPNMVAWPLRGQQTEHVHVRYGNLSVHLWMYFFRLPLCRLSRFDPLRHGLFKTSEGVLWCLAPRPWKCMWCQSNIHANASNQGSQKNVAQSITLPPLTC